MAKRKSAPKSIQQAMDVAESWRTEYWPHLCALRQAAIDAAHGLQGVFDIVPPPGCPQISEWRMEFLEAASIDYKSEGIAINSFAELDAVCTVAIRMLRAVADWQEQKQGSPLVQRTPLDGVVEYRPGALVRSLWDVAQRLKLKNRPPLPAEPLTLHLAMRAIQELAGTSAKPRSPSLNPEQSPRCAAESEASSSPGFLGGAALADALAIHATRRDAFFRKLERQRKGLGDDCWHEVREPRPNSPHFLYRTDSPKLRDLATGYKTPKPA